MAKNFRIGAATLALMLLSSKAFAVGGIEADQYAPGSIQQYLGLPSWATSLSLSGNSTKLGTVSGSLTSGHCLQADSNQNIVDAGASCGTSGGGGSGTVNNSGVG